MVIERIQAMLEACTADSGTFPPTNLYNETWLLRLILDWFSTHKVPDHPLAFLDTARWFSEAALPSQFLANPTNGNRLAEGWSHVDGVIGHFEVGKGHKIDLSFRPTGTQLVVLEAKMFSPLAPGTSNVNYYDQAARIVACIAETLRIAGRYPSELSKLGFYILAPESQIDRGVFEDKMSIESINKKVAQRVKEYVDAGDRAKHDWYVTSFLPTLHQIDLATLKWEDVIQEIEKHDLVFASSIKKFYKKCLKFGQ